MLLDRLIRRLPVRSNAIRTFVGALAAAGLVAAGVAVISRLLGFPTPVGVVAALAAAGAISYVFTPR